MDASNPAHSSAAPHDLLARIANDPAVVAYLAWPGDFDLDRRSPVEELSLPSGDPLHPIAGDGAGGTYFLVGKEGDPVRPVLYADSEGQAALIGASLREAVELVVVCPLWRDAAAGFPLPELEAQVRADMPDFDRAREAVAAALGLTPPPADEAVARLLATAARTVPDFLPYVDDDDHGPYELLIEG
ncbi:hypothetical protein ACFYXS_11215 [Streptomyces sp. NPDC002574]|uniref:hypothetical protein n=1 Tax=Streptomyces sp. NPDC002574 TaxID=3364652 RepID=UPI00369ECB14